MASQALGNFKVEPTQPFMLRDILPGPGWAPYTAPKRVRASRINDGSLEEAAQGSFVKGALIGLLLEAAAGLTLYGLWQVWHLAR